MFFSPEKQLDAGSEKRRKCKMKYNIVSFSFNQVNAVVR
jgi:hypothetical protein